RRRTRGSCWRTAVERGRHRSRRREFRAAAATPGTCRTSCEYKFPLVVSERTEKKGGPRSVSASARQAVCPWQPPAGTGTPEMRRMARRRSTTGDHETDDRPCSESTERLHVLSGGGHLGL